MVVVFRATCTPATDTNGEFPVVVVVTTLVVGANVVDGRFVDVVVAAVVGVVDDVEEVVGLEVVVTCRVVTAAWVVLVVAGVVVDEVGTVVLGRVVVDVGRVVVG